METESRLNKPWGSFSEPAGKLFITVTHLYVLSKQCKNVSTETKQQWHSFTPGPPGVGWGGVCSHPPSPRCALSPSFSCHVAAASYLFCGRPGPFLSRPPASRENQHTPALHSDMCILCVRLCVCFNVRTCTCSTAYLFLCVFERLLVCAHRVGGGGTVYWYCTSLSVCL